MTTTPEMEVIPAKITPQTPTKTQKTPPPAMEAAPEVTI
jgi:hypothetical protein